MLLFRLAALGFLGVIISTTVYAQAAPLGVILLECKSDQPQTVSLPDGRLVPFSLIHTSITVDFTQKAVKTHRFTEYLSPFTPPPAGQPDSWNSNNAIESLTFTPEFAPGCTVACTAVKASVTLQLLRERSDWYWEEENVVTIGSVAVNPADHSFVQTSYVHRTSGTRDDGGRGPDISRFSEVEEHHCVAHWLP